MIARIIAIDGPAGAGKSTVAKLVAKELGYLYIDTGAMYRVVALCAIREKISFDDDVGLKILAGSNKIEFCYLKDTCLVFCNGEDVSTEIRTESVSEAVPVIAAVRSVREVLVEQQRHFAKQGGVVMDGRDIGTYVFPNADCKVFLTAALEERAKRRFLELSSKGYTGNVDEVALEMKKRDERDSKRDFAPLRKADDAFNLECTNLSIAQVAEKVISMAKSAHAPSSDKGANAINLS